MAKDDDKNPTTTPDAASAASPAAAPKAAAAAPEPKPNLTRDGIEGTLRARFIEQGKDEKEAAKLAKKRALEMIPE